MHFWRDSITFLRSLFWFPGHSCAELTTFALLNRIVNKSYVAGEESRNVTEEPAEWARRESAAPEQSAMMSYPIIRRELEEMSCEITNIYSTVLYVLRYYTLGLIRERLNWTGYNVERQHSSLSRVLRCASQDGSFGV